MTSIASGGLTAALLFLAGYRGWGKQAFPLISFSVGLLGHASDILIAKRCFSDWRDPGKVSILGFSARHWGKRVAWYLRSLASMSFARHLMVSAVDSLVVGRLTTIACRHLDRAEVMTKRKWLRDPLVAVFVGLVTFNLYVNVLRFSWVYQSDPNVAITVLMTMWLIGVIYYQLDDPAPGNG